VYLENSPNIEILMLFEKISQCIEEASNYVFTIWILNAIIFYMPSSMSNNGL
jgi:hypothetical protein